MTDAANQIDQLRDIERSLVRREQSRSGGTLNQARQRLASRMGVAPGTLYNLARDRLKRLDARVRDALTAYAIQDIEAEMRGLTHAMEMARQVGAAARPDRLDKVEARLTEARKLLAEAGRDDPFR